MRLVTRNQYSRVMTENIDGMHDIGFSVNVPASTPTTVHESFTVPAGYVAVLRNATGNVQATSAGAGRATALLRMTRPGQPTVDAFQLSSDTGTPAEAKVVSTSYNIIMPEGTEVQACYSNFDGTGTRNVRLYLVIDLIRL
jgi:hypothetical protein